MSTRAPYDEIQQRDFHGRMSRVERARGFGQKTKKEGARIAKRRFLTLALAIAVPAMASPQSWSLPTSGPFSDSAGYAPSVVPMGFETPGMSFPGSAFYYISDLPDLDEMPAQPDYDASAFDLGLLDDSGLNEQSSYSAQLKAGPAARALQGLSRMSDLTRARQCMTMAVYYEAASESDSGQRAVAQVVLNRVAHPSYPSTVCGVVFQGSERSTGCQFSFTCDGSLGRRASSMFWQRAARVSRASLAGSVYAPVGLSTHYHTIAINPYWASSLDHVTTIGAHRFYKWRGSAGKPGAFSFAYRGSEPVPGRHAPLASTDAPPNPVTMGQDYTNQFAPLPASTPAAQNPAAQATAIEPQTSAVSDILPDSGNVREQYANSGQWIVQP